MNDKDPAPTQTIPGFQVDLSADGRWVMNAIGEAPWFVGGFSEHHHALEWVLDYLTTNIENNNRIGAEYESRRIEAEMAQKTQLVEAMMWSEAAANKERKRH
jgi:hypothetical protein